MITADGGGSNGRRCRLWKVSLQELATRWAWRLESAIFLLVPANGTRLNIGCFVIITENWRGRPLTSYEVIVNLIGSTTTKTGLPLTRPWTQRL